MSPPLFIESPHHFYYGTSNPITAAMLADSLLGFEGLVKKAARTMGTLLDAPVRDTVVFIESIKFGSYDENFLIRFLFGKGRNGEKCIEKWRQLLGLKEMDLSRLTRIIVGALIAYGAWKHLSPADKADSPAATAIENSFNNYSFQLGTSSEELKLLLASTVNGKEDLKRDVVRLLHPDGSTQVGSITMDEDKSLQITSDIISAVPSKYIKTPDEDPSADVAGALLVVRAADLDRPELGWAAIAPEISDTRLPASLHGVIPETIPIGKYFHCDITVVYRVDRHGNKLPKAYQINRIRRDLDDKK